MKLDKIIVSEGTFNSSEPHDVINSNITVVNLLREEGIEDENIHEDALTSYYLDYYESQYANGNFSQFVWNSGWNPTLNKLIEKGLTQIGATQHLALFQEQSSKVAALTSTELDDYLESDYFGENPTRDLLNNAAFSDLPETITDLNSKWLKNHPQLEVLSIDAMFAALEKFIGRKVAR